MKKYYSLLVVFLLATNALSGAEIEVGDWSRVSLKAGEWAKGAPKATPYTVYCHLRGKGKFRVTFKTEKGTTQQEVNIAAMGWVSLKDVVPLVAKDGKLAPGEADGGPAEVMAEPIGDAQFDALIATTNPDFSPALRNNEAALYFRIHNNAPQSVRTLVQVASGWSQHPFGLASATGFDPKAGELKAGESTPITIFPPGVRERCNMSFSFLDPADLEIEFYSDAEGKTPIKKMKVKSDKPSKAYCFLIPDNKGKYTLLTLQDLFQRNLNALEKAKLTGAVPQRIWFMAGNIESRAEANTDVLRDEIRMARDVGLNGIYNLGSLEPERAALLGSGPTYGVFPPAFYVNPGANFEFTPAMEEKIRKNTDLARAVTIPSLVKGSDEPRFVEFTQSAATDARLVEWMKGKNLTPQDAGVENWDAVKCIAPIETQKRLSTLSRQFQMDEQIKFWNSSMKLFSEMNPKLLPYINWSCFEYYTGITIDLWELYRNPGQGIVWGEDWLEAEPPGSGITAWYAEQMRSQAKYRNLPMGAYPILGFDGAYAPARDLFKIYERLMRGNTVFFLYPYNPISGEIGWLDNARNPVGVAKLARQIAAVEDIVVGGKVLPAQAAIVYPNSCILWDRAAFEKAAALYITCLHAGIPVDVLSEQDIIDGSAKDYPLLFVVGANIRKEALAALDAYVTRGGIIASSVPEVRNQFDEPVADGAKVFGMSAIQSIKNEAPLGGIGNAGEIAPLDTVNWEGQVIEVISQKSKITQGQKAEVVATFSDGTPALVRTRKGLGIVYQYGFAPGLSYMRADYGKNLRGIFPTALAKNNKERDMALLPAVGLPSIVKTSAAMISGRVTVNKDASVVGLVDYGLGEEGREHPNPESKDVDLETMKPFDVTVEISCKKKPDSVAGVRSGELTWEYAEGKVTVKVPLRGVEMIILKGSDLF
ncbi:MAG: hypothetical protein ABIP97_08660 [Chthoniobacterales bacterium]